MSATDFVDLALRYSRVDFAAAWPGHFLVGTEALTPASSLHRTQSVARADDDDDLVTGIQSQLWRPPAERSARPALVALAVRKVQEGYANMITVGRTANNDVVIPDLRVSKFHAFFREVDGGLQLADAGSRNGTFVGGKQLPTKGKPAAVKLGASIGLGTLRFTLVDAGGAWDFLRREMAAGR